MDARIPPSHASGSAPRPVLLLVIPLLLFAAVLVRAEPVPSCDPGLSSSPVGLEMGDILRRHHRKGSNDPADLPSALERTAAYIGCYPEAAALLRRLSDAPWSLAYAPGTWMTYGAFAFRSEPRLTVYFDLRAGAQVADEEACSGQRSCSIAPADALLHELLHVELMLEQKEDLLALLGGGLHLELSGHEREVLERERHLFAAMKARDGVSRPQRRRHVGELVDAPCATCAPL